MSNPNPIARHVYGALNAALAEYDLNPLDVIAVLTDVSAMALEERVETIKDARHAHASWEQIGIALRTSRQAAHYGYHVVAGIA